MFYGKEEKKKKNYSINYNDSVKQSETQPENFVKDKRSQCVLTLDISHVDKVSENDLIFEPLSVNFPMSLRET